MSAHDFNSDTCFCHSGSTSRWERVTHVFRTDGVRSGDGIPPTARIQHVRAEIPRQCSRARVLLSRSVPCDGLRAVDVSREPAGHRDLFAGSRAQALSRWLSWQDISKHSGRRQQAPRLAHLGRLRPGAHPSCPDVVRQGRLRRGAEARGLCVGLHNDRPVPGVVSLGAIPSPQGSRQAPYAHRPAGQHPLFYPHNSRENARCDGPRPSADRAGRLLHDGQRLHRFRSLAYLHSTTGVLRHPCQEEPRLLSPRVPRRGQVHRTPQRPDDRSSRSQDIPTLSRSAPSHRVSRRRTRPATSLSHEQLRTARPDHRTALPLSLAGRTVLQVDQAKPPDQGVLRQLGQRGEDPGVDRRERLCPGGHPPQGIEARTEPLRNSPNPERRSFRENPCFSGTFDHSCPKSRRCLL